VRPGRSVGHMAGPGTRGAPKTALIAAHPRPARPVHTAEPECGLCIWAPLPGGGWSLKYVHRGCSRHRPSRAAEPPPAAPGQGPDHPARPPGGPTTSGCHRPARPVLARCPEPACPVRYTVGLDRPCMMHADDNGAALLAYAAPRDGRDGNPAALAMSSPPVQASSADRP
jgi:hypothetical protein